jgi:molybdopterin-guanine dinucleotide biosynthesis protein A
MRKKHQKHAKLTRPAYGTFHRREWAILGTPCGKIQQLSRDLMNQLSENYRLAYVDADHKHGDDDTKDPNSGLTYGATLAYTDKITHHRFDTMGKMDSFQFRPWFDGQDGVLVNGNHFRAKRQIVVIDPKKKGSLRRKLDRLTDVCALLLTEEGPVPYDFLEEHLENIETIPTFQLRDVSAIAKLLEEELAHQPPVYGLVLAGGKSQRMGQDKGLIDYHGKPQREHLYQLLDPFCDQTFLSCRPDQQEEMPTGYPLLPDSFLGLGPFGAILSAFREHPDAAWLVVACDLPLIDPQALEELIGNRNPSRVATAFHNPETNFPEPLITLWEPRAYPILLQFLTQGYSCPRKVLINADIEVIQPERPEVLRNINTPEEKEVMMTRLK